MAKKVQGIVTLVLQAGNAAASEVLGPALGAFGVNIESFIKDFNAQTASYPAGTLVTAVVTIYDDFSYTFTVFP